MIVTSPLAILSRLVSSWAIVHSISPIVWYNIVGLYALQSNSKRLYIKALGVWDLALCVMLMYDFLFVL